MIFSDIFSGVSKAPSCPITLMWLNRVKAVICFHFEALVPSFWKWSIVDQIFFQISDMSVSEAFLFSTMRWAFLRAFSSRMRSASCENERVI